MTKTLSINLQDTWALLIGVGKFTDEKLDDIPAVINNLAKLRQLLENTDIVGIPTKQIIGDTEVPKNHSDILRQLDKLPPKKVDTLFVYYVGHGILYNGPDVGCQKLLYLACSETPFDKSNLALPFVELWNETFVRATNLIYILDCCRSGNALNTVKLVPNENISVLTATLPNTKALAPKGERYTAFTKHLIELLESGFGKAPTLTTTEIRKQLKARLPSEELPSPWGDDRFGTKTEEPLRIAYNRSFSQVGETEVPKKTVFLAEVTDDLVESRSQVRSFLDQRKDIRVLPMQDDEVSSEKLTEDLQQSDLFIQLLSDLPGKRDLAKTQYDCAKAAGRNILQWCSPKLKLAEVQNEIHRELLKGVTVKKMELAEFQEDILKQLFPPKKPTASKLTAGALVMVNTTQEDMKLLGEINRFLKEKKITYATAAKVSGKILAGQEYNGVKEHKLSCTYCFNSPDFPGEKLALKWLLLSHPTTTP